MKILIAHDWALIRAGIRQILKNEFGPLEVTETSAAAANFDLAAGPWDLAFVGVDAAGRRGLDFLTRLKRAHPRQRVLAICRRAKTAHFEHALKNLIHAAIARESAKDAILTAARSALSGAAAVARKHTRGSHRTPALSKRELDVVRLLAAGKNLKGAAAELNVSESTISTYRVRILRKLNLASTAALIRYAVKNDLAD